MSEKAVQSDIFVKFENNVKQIIVRLLKLTIEKESSFLACVYIKYPIPTH